MARARKKRGGEAERITIIVVIIIAMLVVAAAIAIQLFNTPERSVKSKIENIASDYYENYFYKKIVKNGTTDVIGKYKETGFARVYFRQFLLYDNEKYASEAPLIKKYCDENSSFVIFYPDPPYGQTNYHVEYNYSCEF